MAPLYDIGSALPYYDMNELKLAMRIGRHYDLASINARDWDRLGAVGGIESPRQRVRAMAQRLPDHVEALCKKFKARRLATPIIDRLRTRIREQVKSTLQMLDAADAID